MVTEIFNIIIVVVVTGASTLILLIVSQLLRDRDQNRLHMEARDLLSDPSFRYQNEAEIALVTRLIQNEEYDHLVEVLKINRRLRGLEQ